MAVLHLVLGARKLLVFLHSGYGAWQVESLASVHFGVTAGPGWKPGISMSNSPGVGDFCTFECFDPFSSLW